MWRIGAGRRRFWYILVLWHFCLVIADVLVHHLRHGCKSIFPPVVCQTNASFCSVFLKYLSQHRMTQLEWNIIKWKRIENLKIMCICNISFCDFDPDFEEKILYFKPIYVSTDANISIIWFKLFSVFFIFIIRANLFLEKLFWVKMGQRVFSSRNNSHDIAIVTEFSILFKTRCST